MEGRERLKGWLRPGDVGILRFPLSSKTLSGLYSQVTPSLK